MISFTASGSTANTKLFLEKMKSNNLRSACESLAQRGVSALEAGTPKDSGLTAASWSYTIETNRGGIRITWRNGNINDGVNIAVILQYGHGTGSGGYVAGRDYINPAMQPIFDEIATDVWKKVVSA